MLRRSRVRGALRAPCDPASRSAAGQTASMVTGCFGGGDATARGPRWWCSTRPSPPSNPLPILLTRLLPALGRPAVWTRSMTRRSGGQVQTRRGRAVHSLQAVPRRGWPSGQDRDLSSRAGAEPGRPLAVASVLPGRSGLLSLVGSSRRPILRSQKGAPSAPRQINDLRGGVCSPREHTPLLTQGEQG